MAALAESGASLLDLYRLHRVSLPRRLRQHNGEIAAGARRTHKCRPWSSCAWCTASPTSTRPSSSSGSGSMGESRHLQGLVTREIAAADAADAAEAPSSSSSASSSSSPRQQQHQQQQQQQQRQKKLKALFRGSGAKAKLRILRGLGCCHPSRRWQLGVRFPSSDVETMLLARQAAGRGSIHSSGGSGGGGSGGGGGGSSSSNGSNKENSIDAGGRHRPFPCHIGWPAR